MTMRRPWMAFFRNSTCRLVLLLRPLLLLLLLLRSLLLLPLVAGSNVAVKGAAASPRVSATKRDRSAMGHTSVGLWSALYRKASDMELADTRRSCHVSTVWLRACPTRNKDNRRISKPLSGPNHRVSE